MPCKLLRANRALQKYVCGDEHYPTSVRDPMKQINCNDAQRAEGCVLGN